MPRFDGKRVSAAFNFPTVSHEVTETKQVRLGADPSRPSDKSISCLNLSAAQMERPTDVLSLSSSISSIETETLPNHLPPISSVWAFSIPFTTEVQQNSPRQGNSLESTQIVHSDQPSVSNNRLSHSNQPSLSNRRVRISGTPDVFDGTGRENELHKQAATARHPRKKHAYNPNASTEPLKSCLKRPVRKSKRKQKIENENEYCSVSATPLCGWMMNQHELEIDLSVYI